MLNICSGGLMEINIESLKESNEFLNILFENITSAIFLVDQDIRISSINNSFQTLFYNHEDLILGQLCGNAIGCGNTDNNNVDCGTTKNCESCTLLSSVKTGFIKKVPSQKQIITREFNINGVLIQKHFQFSTRYIRFNEQDMILVVIDDITEFEDQKKNLAEKNKRLEQLNNQKNELLGIAAHDLRSPLSVIDSFAEIMQETVDDLKPESIKEMLKIIKNTSHNTLNLLNDILDFSKIESGTVELKKIKINYIRFVKENIARNEFLSLQKNILIEFSSDKEDIQLQFDPRRIDQVLNNLISNALKYSFPGNGIKIAVNEDNGFIITTVEDKGQGIPEKDIPHLFKPFSQASVKATNNEKSTGLGLAIVKKIIEFHNGLIKVKSKPGEGSSFSFYLPKL